MTQSSAQDVEVIEVDDNAQLTREDCVYITTVVAHVYSIDLPAMSQSDDFNSFIQRVHTI